MKTRLMNIWELVRTSLWFLPGLMVVAAMVLAVAMLAVDRWFETEPDRLPTFLYTLGAENAREVLSTIAGSMITIAGVAFSITIVALTLASSQFGPHLLRNFMKDKGNQFVLGTFIATFIYCLIVLRLVHETDSSVFIPSASLTFAILLALVDVGVLIYFIHHISVSIQADSVITAVFNELVRHLYTMFPQGVGEEPQEETESAPIEEKSCPRGDHIAAIHSGYLQAIDGDGLLRIARKSDLILHLRCGPGDYIVAGTALATLECPRHIDLELAHKIRKCFITGSHRTPEQDAEFGISQLVEVAARALSPSTNSPFTAVTCVDRLGSAICLLTRRVFPSPYRYDQKGNLRVIARPPTFRGLMDAAFDQIREHGRSSAAVMLRILETLRTIALHVRNSEQKEAVGRQADMTLQAALENLREEFLKDEVRWRYQAVIEALS